MAFSVEMPELGESVTEGTITTWLKQVGDTVEADEPLLEVSTDKVDTEIPSPASGVLLKVLFEEDDTVDVGEVIAEIGEEGEEPSGNEDKAEEKKPEAATKSDSGKSEDAEEVKDAAAGAQGGDASGDATDVTMPELGESVTEGTITTWLKQVGDTVEVDEPLLEVSTDKVDTEVPSPVAGTIVEILADEDDTIEVGAVIARVGDPNAAPKKADKAEKKEAPKAEPKAEEKQAEEPKKAEPSKAAKSGEKVPYVTPLVRKLAEKHGVDLNSISGTGVGGRIRKQDVLAAVEGEQQSGEGEQTAASAEPTSVLSTKGVDPEKAKLRGTTKKVNRIRQITATKTRESLQTTAQLTQLHEVDVTDVAALRKANKQAFQKKHGANLTFLPFFVKAAAEALVSHPNVNASYNEDTKEMTYHEHVNISIAVDTPQGLLTPVIKDADKKTLPELAQAIGDLADRARNSKLTPSDLTGGTFTITNFGSVGALSDTPILTPPQAGIMGTGAIVKRPVVKNFDGQETIAIRSMVYLPLTYDHRVVDGADAGRFMTTVRDRLETANFTGDLGL